MLLKDKKNWKSYEKWQKAKTKRNVYLQIMLITAHLYKSHYENLPT
jgi:hypothetical protein